MSTPWRGTLIFTGTLAAAAAVTAARFVDVAGAAQPAPGPATSSAAPTSDVGSAPATSPAASTVATPSASTPTDAATPDPVRTLPDGTVLVVGDEVMTPHGPVELAVTFAGHDIVAVQALETPDWEGESAELNPPVVSLLTQRAIAADSADIGTVSGATYTSDAYRQSLQSAIDRRG